jgi:hypothetical protein
MAITALHPLYVKRKSQWKLIRDCVEGTDAIKAAGEKYLPRNAGWCDQQYEAYKKRARWNNYTAQNLSGLHGLIFRRNPIITTKGDEISNSGILENIDKKGTNLYQFASDTIYDAMQTCFGGYLVDQPPAPENISKAEAERLGIRSYIRYYPAESITNWGYDIVNGVEKLVYVILKEETDNSVENDFEHKISIKYRLLDLRDGFYKQFLYSEETDEKTKKTVWNCEEIPVLVNGKSLDYIPFITLPGSTPEKPMFYDLAQCNIGHYQKSADYENGVHLTTIPTGYVTGHTLAENPETKEKEVIRLGWDSFLVFPEENAKVGNLSFSGVGLVHSETAINQALADMAILGSRLLVTEKGTSESADSAKIHRAGENARLATFAKNAAEKLTQAVKIMAEWMQLETNIRIEFCTDYDTLAFDPNALNAVANLSRENLMPLPASFYNLKNGEYLPPEMTLGGYAVLLELAQKKYSPTQIVQVYNDIQSGGDGIGLINKFDKENESKTDITNEPIKDIGE